MTLPAKYYTDPEIFRSEMERFYFGRWIYAGRAERIEKPGDYFLCDVAGESVIVTREGAFYNVCRHRGTRMCKESEGNFAGRIQCPYHGWTYGLDGSLISAPNMGDAGFSRFDYPLHKVACDDLGRPCVLEFRSGAGAASRTARGIAREIRGVEDGRAEAAQTHRLRRQGQLEADHPELQRVPALPDACILRSTG